MTWDGRDTLVCFGGSTSSSTDNGLWAYSISRREWSAVAARGAVPPPRTHHSAVLLRPGQVLVFGGCNAQGVFFQVCVCGGGLHLHHRAPSHGGLAAAVRAAPCTLAAAAPPQLPHPVLPARQRSRDRADRAI
jgi:hypothetical protein